MKHESEDERHDSDWDVTQCACGHLTLRLGTVRLDFSPEKFAQLQRLVNGAMQQFQVGGGREQGTGSKTFMH